MIETTKPSWKAPHLAAASTRRNTAVFGLLIVLVVLSTMYESVLIKPAVSVALGGQDNVVGYAVSAVLALTAAFSMLESGYLHRKAEVEGSRSRLPWALVIGWALIGISLTILRLLPVPEAVTSGNAFSSTSSTVDGPPLYVVAPVMLLVYVGAGLLSRATGATLFNPTAQAHASARRTRSALERRIAKQRARASRRFEQLEVARGEFDTVATYRRVAEATIDGYFEQLRQRTHLRMLLPLGDPSITSAVGQSPFEEPASRDESGPESPVRAAS